MKACDPPRIGDDPQTRSSSSSQTDDARRSRCQSNRDLGSDARRNRVTKFRSRVPSKVRKIPEVSAGHLHDSLT